MRVAWLGTGLMGLPMVERLARAGHSLFAWNRTQTKAAALSRYGVTLCTSPDAAMRDCEVVITMLANAAVAEELVYRSNAFHSLARGTLLVDMSTTAPAHAREQARVLSVRGVKFLDAPVSGGTRGARDGTLTIFAGGDAADVAHVAPLLGVLGTVRHIGPVGAGQLTKLTNQIIVAGTIGAVAEGLAFAERAQLDIDTVRQALAGGFAESRVLREHGERMAKGDFEPGGPNQTFLKDLDLILDAAQAASADVSITRHIRAMYSRLIQEGHGSLDHSSLILEYRSRY